MQIKHYREEVNRVMWRSKKDNSFDVNIMNNFSTNVTFVDRIKESQFLHWMT